MSSDKKYSVFAKNVLIISFETYTIHVPNICYMKYFIIIQGIKKMGDTERLNRLTHMDQAQRQKLITYFGRLGESSRIEAHKLQIMLARNQPKNEPRDPLFFYAMLILSLSRMKHIETSLAIKQTTTEEHMEKITRIRIERIKDKRSEKASPVKQKIEVKYFRMIQKFRDPESQDFMSWQMISDYIARYHKERIPRNTLRRCYTEIYKDKNERGEI